MLGTEILGYKLWVILLIVAILVLLGSAAGNAVLGRNADKHFEKLGKAVRKGVVTKKQAQTAIGTLAYPTLGELRKLLPKLEDKIAELDKELSDLSAKIEAATDDTTKADLKKLKKEKLNAREGYDLVTEAVKDLIKKKSTS